MRASEVVDGWCSNVGRRTTVAWLWANSRRSLSSIKRQGIEEARRTMREGMRLRAQDWAAHRLRQTQERDARRDRAACAPLANRQKVKKKGGHERSVRSEGGYRKPKPSKRSAWTKAGGKGTKSGLGCSDTVEGRGPLAGGEREVVKRNVEARPFDAGRSIGTVRPLMGVASGRESRGRDAQLGARPLSDVCDFQQPDLNNG